MGKFFGMVAIGGALAMITALVNRRNGRRMNWSKMWNRSLNIMGNRNVKRVMRRGRRMIRSWT